MNVVPLPTSLSKVKVPPCLVTTTDRAMASPCPVPLPTSLVVKKGSNTRFRIASGIPDPESVTSMRATLPSRDVLIRMLPMLPPLDTTSPMACAALVMRFRKTWFRSPT